MKASPPMLTETTHYRDAPELLWSLAMASRLLRERADGEEHALLREIVDGLDQQLLSRMRSGTPEASRITLITGSNRNLSQEGRYRLRA